jgi:hypothetical protein
VVELVIQEKWKEVENVRGQKVTIFMPDSAARQTRGKSMLPGSRDLEELDAGRTFANLGIMVVPPVRNPDGLQAGDVVLYQQHSARAGFTLQSSRMLKELLGRDGYVFVIPTDAVLTVLEDGIPAAGRLW